jgi:ferritin-like metal-binding protein YciE
MEGIRMAQQSGGRLDNLTYDIITVIHEKSKGLEAYDRYLQDAQRDQEARQCLEEIRRSDEQHIQRLQQVLSRCLQTSQRAA